MGGKSTSTGAVFNSKQTDTKGNFDLRSWQGLTEVLRAGKESLKDAYVYGEFRNLVLEYAQKGGDEEIKRKIIAITSTFRTASADAVPVKDVVTEKVEEIIHPKTDTQSQSVIATEVQNVSNTPSISGVQKRPDMIARRPAPSFIPKIVTQETPVDVVPADLPTERIQVDAVLDRGESPIESVKDVPETERVQSSTPLKIAKIGNTSIPGFESVQEPESEPEIIVESTIKSAPQVFPRITKIGNTSIPGFEVKKEKLVEEQAPVQKTLEEHKARITEIKHAVREKVGNPAALVDTANEVGKKYMVALLTALKATSPGSAVSVESAMGELEQAYTAVLGVASNVVTVSPKEIPKPPVQTTPQPEPVVPQREVPKEVPVQKKPFVPLTLQQKVNSVPVQPKVQTPHVPRPVRSPADVISSFKKDVRKPVPSTPVPASVEVSKPTQVPNVVAAPVAEVIVSVPKPVLSENQIPKSEDISLSQHARQATESMVQQSELSTPEIGKALESLLHEWSLFSGSGILGIGPGGSEHPLYMKIANLSMGEVLAGRFEKANFKDIKVIKEYVNAWRHEQGIAYNVNETFEHYLRRVVQRILKRQQG